MSRGQCPVQPLAAGGGAGWPITSQTCMTPILHADRLLDKQWVFSYRSFNMWNWATGYGFFCANIRSSPQCCKGLLQETNMTLHIRFVQHYNYHNNIMIPICPRRLHGSNGKVRSWSPLLSLIEMGLAVRLLRCEQFLCTRTLPVQLSLVSVYLAHETNNKQCCRGMFA